MGAQEKRRSGTAVLIAALGLVACGAPQESTTAANVDVSSLVLPGVAGGTISLAKLRGKVVVLHLFTTWSVASQVDVHQLKALRKRGYADVIVIGVALDHSGADLVPPWQRAMATTYPIALATTQLRNGKSMLGRIRRAPTTLIVNRFGRVRNRVERQLKPQELARLVEAARRAR